MSKNLKRIIAMAMVVGTISVAAPAVSNANFLTTKAYASSDENDTDTFNSLKLETSDGSSIKLYDDDSYDSDNKVDSDDVKEDTDYYAKTSSNTIHIDIDGVSSKYVRVFRKDGDDGISDSTKGKKVSSDVSLSSGKNTIVVRIYDEEPDDNPRYDDDSDKSNDYTIYLKCTGSDSSSDDSSDNNDDIYLKSLSINGDSVSLSDSQTTYTYNVASNIDSVPIKAKPDDSDYTVEIDGDEVDDGDNYKKDVDLNKGENDIKVKLTDEDDNERDYTLKITRADSTAASTATNTAATQTSTAGTVATGKVGWVQANGGWQYNDSIGAPLKSQWLFDRNDGKWYYLGTDGMMAHDTYVGKWRVGSDGAWIS
jgi:archaellum component FlaG (FlaF/FlaG flagellin family)